MCVCMCLVEGTLPQKRSLKDVWKLAVPLFQGNLSFVGTRSWPSTVLKNEVQLAAKINPLCGILWLEP